MRKERSDKAGCMTPVLQEAKLAVGWCIRGLEQALVRLVAERFSQRAGGA